MNGTPSILTETPRRALNIAYYIATRNMNAEEVEEFEAEISRSMLELAMEQAVEKLRAVERRKTLAEQLGEVK